MFPSEVVMDAAGPESSTASPHRHPWLRFLAGVLLFVTGPLGYVVQSHWKPLSTPWYWPILAATGTALMLQSLFRPWNPANHSPDPLRTPLWSRWYVFAVVFQTPKYTRAAQPGQMVPRFRASPTDGRASTAEDLKQGMHSVLLFCRGRW
jgi:hypothetical protein